jgi:hypothetical protein
MNFPGHYSAPPYGYNDNSNSLYNRNIPSNLSNNNKFSNTHNYNSNNYNKVFQQNSPLIEPIDYNNQNNTVHNNLNNNLLNEYVEEYRINIDSTDRDINVYPNIFNFTTIFSPANSATINEQINIDEYDKSAGQYTKSTRASGSPYPHILKTFKNVKYIKLDSVILPQCYNYTCENNEYMWDRKYCLLDERFLILRIKELENDGIKVYSTSDDSLQRTETVQPFGTLYQDKILNKTFYSASPYSSYRTFKRSQLANISKLTIQLFNSRNEPLHSNTRTHDDHHKPILHTDIRHPLHKNNQIYFSFLIGVCEPELNNAIKYER